jgi:inner membrane protein
MASAFTHVYAILPLVSLASSVVSRKRAVALLAVVAVLPDLDVLGFAWGIPYEHPLGHRGATHSLLFAAMIGGAAAGILARHPSEMNNARLRLFIAVTLACASHGVLDAMTDAGLGVGFALPFSSERFFFSWRPIATSPVDPAAFFSQRGLAILATEVVWVWIPVTITWFGITRLRRERTRQRHKS